MKKIYIYFFFAFCISCQSESPEHTELTPVHSENEQHREDGRDSSRRNSRSSSGSSSGSSGSSGSGSSTSSTSVSRARSTSSPSTSRSRARSTSHWINSVTFVRIDAGKFIMRPDVEAKYQGKVSVEITKPFEIMETELTQKQWLSMVVENPSHFSKSGDCDDHEVTDRGWGMCPNHPVEQVSWQNVQDFIKFLNDSLGLTGCNGKPGSSSGCYRLPTEAEWEFAVRAGTSTKYFFGDDHSNLGNYAWYRKNAGQKTHKVRQKSANPEGLYDVYGNVQEWVMAGCNNWQCPLPGGKDPVVDFGSGGVIRGGSYQYDEKFQTSSSRGIIGPNGAKFIGFRLVKTL